MTIPKYKVGDVVVVDAETLNPSGFIQGVIISAFLNGDGVSPAQWSYSLAYQGVVINHIFLETEIIEMPWNKQ